MAKKVKRAEIVPAGLDALVRERVSEALAMRDDRAFQPWFRNREETVAIRARQSAFQLRKWQAYFARWGCLVCRRKNRPHSSLGMCSPCRMRIYLRLRAVVRHLADERSAVSIRQAVESLDKPVRTARALLAGPEEEK